jgi:hypothetical protein
VTGIGELTRYFDAVQVKPPSGTRFWQVRGHENVGKSLT